MNAMSSDEFDSSCSLEKTFKAELIADLGFRKAFRLRMVSERCGSRVILSRADGKRTNFVRLLEVAQFGSRPDSVLTLEVTGPDAEETMTELWEIIQSPPEPPL